MARRHVIAHIRLDVDFDTVTIIPDVERNSNGHVTLTSPEWFVEAWNNGGSIDDAEFAQRIEHAVIISLAGSKAQKLFFPRSKWQQGHGICRDMHGDKYLKDGSDVHKVDYLLDELHQGNEKIARQHRQYLEARADDLVQANRADIERVAKALLERKTLTHAEVRAVMFPPDTIVEDDIEDVAPVSEEPVYFVDRDGRASDLLLAVCRAGDQ